MSTLAALENVSVSDRSNNRQVDAAGKAKREQESGVGCRTTGTGLWPSAFCPYKGRRGRMAPLHRAITELDPSSALARSTPPVAHVWATTPDTLESVSKTWVFGWRPTTGG